MKSHQLQLDTFSARCFRVYQASQMFRWATSLIGALFLVINRGSPQVAFFPGLFILILGAIHTLLYKLRADDLPQKGLLQKKLIFTVIVLCLFCIFNYLRFWLSVYFAKRYNYWSFICVDWRGSRVASAFLPNGYGSPFFLCYLCLSWGLFG